MMKFFYYFKVYFKKIKNIMDKKLSNYGEYDEDCEIEEDIQYEGKFDDVDNIDDDQQDEFIESISTFI